MDFKVILVLSPHTDDGELGAGGTISRFVLEDKVVYYVAFSGCEASVPQGLPKDTLRKECNKSMKVLGIRPERVKILDYEVRTLPKYRQEILEILTSLKKEIHPDLVLVPSSSDVHQDHAVIHMEAIRAFKKEASIWGYEHPWNNLSFSTDILVSLEVKNIDVKVECLKEYVSQEGKSYMDEENIRALARTRGSQIDKKNAEAFELVRLII
jgi:N-acetylglucosamine malate deacetylase 1